MVVSINKYINKSNLGDENLHSENMNTLKNKIKEDIRVRKDLPLLISL